MSIEQSVQALRCAMEHENIQAEKGLGEELFLFASTLMPVVNVDLLVTDKQGKVLLSWRDDPHCGTGWHVPGGCVRFRETLADRVHKTAQAELGREICFEPEVLHVFEIINEEERNIQNQRERAHFITLVMACFLDDFDVATQQKKPGEPGYLQWFSQLPEDLLSVQKCYCEQWSTIKNKLKGKIANGYLEK